ncbi:hypothetical protein A2V82_16685 [candidate division KSB1 bacterium RBG_16_48_16]|nr:MAG: hypothetical protein A2V82_16685 [candidate division KSB1 bacterium RBG_16_48_16]
MAATIYDVAKHAGVGIGTVSRALNNRPNINAATKEKILKIASDLNYAPHGVAQSLARKKTHSIACVVPFFFSYFYLGLLKRIHNILGAYQYDLILYSLDRVDTRDNALERILTERKADGLLIISLELSDSYARRFMDSPLPVVIVDHFHDRLDSIGIANVRGAKEATEHLIKLGHKRIGMINANISSFPARSRLDGFKSALNESGLEFRESLVKVPSEELGEHGFNEIAGYECMKKMISLEKEMPTAIFVASDVQAVGAMRAAKEAGIRIPEDVALVGFDDIDFAKYMGLTTMRQPLQTMADLAVERLMKKMARKSTDEFHVELKAELIVRESCGARKKYYVNKDQ